MKQIKWNTKCIYIYNLASIITKKNNFIKIKNCVSRRIWCKCHIIYKQRVSFVHYIVSFINNCYDYIYISLPPDLSLLRESVDICTLIKKLLAIAFKNIVSFIAEGSQTIHPYRKHHKTNLITKGCIG